MNFRNFYQKLNQEQKQAVDEIEGPVMVIAGPGTGKTRVLTLRIANILKKTDIEPENILVLTFTESGVASVRNQLIDIIGSAAYSVSVFTFHGFCNYIIQKYSEDFPLLVGAVNISEIDQIRIIEEILKNFNWQYLKPLGDPLFYVKSINNSIEKLKREGVSVKDFLEIIKREEQDFKKNDDLYNNKGVLKGKYQSILRRIEKNKELAKFYKLYQERLKQLNFYDYNDMIISVLNIFSKNKEFLLKIQEQYLYFLIDEHQDTNKAQNKILELLCNFHSNPNIFVVGDEKQAIYRFQGASLENFYFFQKIYPKSKLIKFHQNYRSSQIILNSADNIISGEKLNSNNKIKEKIILNVFPDIISEVYFLSTNLPVKGSVAILCRENKDVFFLADFLKRQQIDFSVDSDQDILKDVDIKKIILLLELINNFKSQELFFEALHIDFLKINPIAIYNFKNNTYTGKIKEFYQTITQLVIDSKNHNLLDFFEKLIQKTGFLSYASKDINKIIKLNAFFDELQLFVQNNKKNTLGDFLEHLNLLQKYNILIKKNLGFNKRIRVMTTHKAKGLEFDHVFIFKANDGTWGNKRIVNHLKISPNVFSLTGRKVPEQDLNDDERKLFYVALTRAKKRVYLSYAKKSIDQREKLPCLFLKEINPSLLKIHYHQKNIKNIFNLKNASQKTNKEKELIFNLFLKNGLSITGLNNYLTCPWRYFYLNLLKIRQVKQNHQMYGIAVHQALKDFFDQKGNKKFLLDRFNYYLKKEPMDEASLKEFLKKGQKALSLYYQEEHNFNVITEFTIPGILLTPSIKLNGRIDKLEIYPQGVNVVDYKTGKSKSKNYIEGKTKDSDGNIKRQLIFYKLLLNNYKKRKYNVISGEIDFVEPNEKGFFKKEKFFIEDSEVIELEELIKEISQEIINYSFKNKKCDDKNCQFCQLREMMERH